MSVTPADVQTPDAIRPEWVQAAGAALNRYEGAEPRTDHADANLHRASIVLAAVCGDIVEAARRDALTAATDAIGSLMGSGQRVSIEPDRWRALSDAHRIVTDLRDADTPRRPQEPPQSDERAEVVPASTPQGSDAPTPDDVAALTTRHSRFVLPTDGSAWCAEDDYLWPCDTARLLALVAAQAEQIARLTGERDRAREECGHEKAMRAHGSEELSTFVRLNRDHRQRAERAEAAVERVRALCDEAERLGGGSASDYDKGAQRLAQRALAALDGAE